LFPDSIDRDHPPRPVAGRGKKVRETVAKDYFQRSCGKDGWSLRH